MPPSENPTQISQTGLRSAQGLILASLPFLYLSEGLWPIEKLTHQYAFRILHCQKSTPPCRSPFMIPNSGQGHQVIKGINWGTTEAWGGQYVHLLTQLLREFKHRKIHWYLTWHICNMKMWLLANSVNPDLKTHEFTTTAPSWNHPCVQTCQQ